MLYSKSISVGTSILKLKLTEEMISDLNNKANSIIKNEIHRSSVEKIIEKCGKSNG